MLLGLLLVFLAGLTWNAEGIGVSYCAAKKLSYDLVQGWLYLFCAVVSIIASLCAGDFVNNSPKVLVITFLFLFLSGAANFFTFVLTAKAMAKGPNGLIWGIMQAGMIGSFLMGIIVFHEKPEIIRFAGLFLIIAGVFAMGCGKASSGERFSRKEWLPASLLAFVLVGTTHCLCTYPSFVPELAKTSSMYRSIGMYSGGFLAFAFYSLPAQIRKHDLGSKGVFVIVGVLIIEKLLSSYLFLYPGIDMLAKFGAGGIGYPVAIGVCVGGFSLYSLIFLKEKVSKTGLAGLAAVLVGIVLISLK